MMKNNSQLYSAWITAISIVAIVIFLPVLSNSQNPRFPADHYQIESECLAPILDVPEVWKADGYLFVSARGVAEFSRRINIAGGCGYRLVSLTKWPLARNQRFDQMILFGIVRYEGEETFEYDWFEAFTPGETQTRINYRAQSGFYFRELLPFSVAACGKSGDANPGKTDTERILDQALDSISFYYGGIYFLEKRSNRPFKPEYRVAIGVIGWKEKPSEQLESELSENADFRPVAFGKYKVDNRYAFGVLLEKGVETANASELHVIRTEFGFEKKVKSQGKAGFEMILSDEMGAFRHALLQKRDDGLVRQYSWINTTSRNFEKQLQKLTNSSFRQIAVTTKTFECDSVESQMVFAKTENRLNTKYLYKSLRLDFPPAFDAARFSESGTHKLFTKLLEEGFIFKDLYFDNDIYALFEKEDQQKKQEVK